MAARKMTIEFGLMNLACRRESAVLADRKLTNLCTGQEGFEPHGPTPLRQDPSFCPTCGHVDRDTLVKGEGSGSTWAVLEAEAIEALSEKAVEFSEHTSLKLIVHPAEQFLAVTAPSGSVYYVTPEPTAADHYALLASVIGNHPELTFTGLLSLSTGGKAKLFALSVRDGVLVLEERVREQSLKPAPEVTGTINEALLGMVETTLDQFVIDYDPIAYEDKYATVLASVLASAEVVSTDSATSVPTQGDADIMAKLAALKGV